MNRGRPRHDDILTPREWQVLELIERGLTNEEIAERLGINFGTAKYHVSEIITKLGAESREEAVRNARDRQRRLPAIALGPLRLTLAPRWFAAAGLAGATALALILIVGLFGGLRPFGSGTPPSENGNLSQAAADFGPGDEASQLPMLDQQARPLSSFYFESVLTSEQGLPGERESTPPRRTEVWFQAPNLWRIHVYTADTDELERIGVSDGDTMWLYNLAENTYLRSPAPAPGDRLGGLIGVMPSPTIREYFDEHEPEHLEWVVESREPVAGVDAFLINQVCCALSGDVRQVIQEKRHWIDPEYMFLLRIREESVTGWTQAEATKVEYEPDLSPDLFVFEPPPGATQQ